jgi:NAD(P)-dependent dehydrogenase (short-subunit alcohol dehydrogenase family)
VAKAAVINITVSLAKELVNSGITVHTVTPGRS